MLPLLSKMKKKNSIQNLWIVYFSSRRPLYLEQFSFHATTSTINKVKRYLIKYENNQQFMRN